mgnify:CR=1 FL=1
MPRASQKQSRQPAFGPAAAAKSVSDAAVRGPEVQRSRLLRTKPAPQKTAKMIPALPHTFKKDYGVKEGVRRERKLDTRRDEPAPWGATFEW